MNLILFESRASTASLPRIDPRAVHLLGVLQRQVGDSFDAGVINGPRGKGTITEIGPDALALTFVWGSAPPPPDPLTLVIGLPRPQTARDILRDATALGVSALHFVATEKGEPSYGQSTLWSSGEWRRHLLDGAQQAFDTRLPAVTHGRSLAEVITALPRSGTLLTLDNYESPQPLSMTNVVPPVTVAFGPERGWSTAERDLLRTNGFAFAHLGPRVLRSETAVIAAVAVIRAKLGLI